MKTYFQCKLRQGDNETTGWIEQRGAKVGARIELKGAHFDNVESIADDADFWDVIEVYPNGLSENVLRQKQANDRNALPSIVGQSR